MNTRDRVIAALTFLYGKDYVAEGELFHTRRQERVTLLSGWWFKPPDDQPFFVGRDKYETLDLARELVQEERTLGVVGPSGRRWEVTSFT